MIALSNRRQASLFASLALGALSSACSFNSAVELPAPCVQGWSESCACDDGSLGTHVCDAHGALGACACGAAGVGGTSGETQRAGESGCGGLGGTIAPGWDPVVIPSVDAGSVEGEVPYGECRDDGSCDSPMLCVFNATRSMPRYCAAVCGDNGFPQPGCPPRPDGTPVPCVNNLCM